MPCSLLLCTSIMDDYNKENKAYKHYANFRTLKLKYNSDDQSLKQKIQEIPFPLLQRSQCPQESNICIHSFHMYRNQRCVPYLPGITSDLQITKHISLILLTKYDAKHHYTVGNYM
jgi:hypothetical protein